MKTEEMLIITIAMATQNRIVLPWGMIEKLSRNSTLPELGDIGMLCFRRNKSP